jgi:hypothetical protein
MKKSVTAAKKLAKKPAKKPVKKIRGGASGAHWGCNEQR